MTTINAFPERRGPPKVDSSEITHISFADLALRKDDFVQTLGVFFRTARASYEFSFKSPDGWVLKQTSVFCGQMTSNTVPIRSYELTNLNITVGRPLSLSELQDGSSVIQIIKVYPGQTQHCPTGLRMPSVANHRRSFPVSP